MPLPPGFVLPCLPTKAAQPPTGNCWLHEIKHDGFRVIARKGGDGVWLYSRPGNDPTYRSEAYARQSIFDGIVRRALYRRRTSPLRRPSWHRTEIRRFTSGRTTSGAAAAQKMIYGSEWLGPAGG